MSRLALVLLALLLLLGPASVSAQGAPRAGDYWCMVANETDRVGDPFLLTRYAPVRVIRTQAGEVAYHMRPGDQPWHQSLRTFTALFARCLLQADVPQRLLRPRATAVTTCTTTGEAWALRTTCTTTID